MGLSMSFYSDFIQSLSKIYPNFIQRKIDDGHPSGQNDWGVAALFNMITPHFFEYHRYSSSIRIEDVQNQQNGAEHGVWTPHEAFVFGFGHTNWADRLWVIWGIFGRFISTHCGTVGSFLVHIFYYYFFKKLSLYIQIPKNYLGVGVKFGLERIRNLVIVCP